jgi:hypothetical protein
MRTPTVSFVAVTFCRVDKPVTLRAAVVVPVERMATAAEILVAVTLPAVTVPAITVPAVTPVAMTLVDVTVVANTLVAVTFVAVTSCRDDRPVTLRAPAVAPVERIATAALTLVPTNEERVAFVPRTLVVLNKPVVMLVEPSVPLTVRVKLGAVVPTPTFPPVVKMLPIVFEVPTAEREVLAKTTPADTLVSTKLVEVILTTVRVPATFKLPDKWALAPLIVVAFNRAVPTVVAETVPAVIVPAITVPAVIPVATTLVVVTVVANTLVAVTLVAVTP